MRQDYYTYAYLREDGTPYYIGKGRSIRINNPAGRVTPMPPLNRRVKIRTGMTEDEALAHEKELIAYYGRKDLGEGILRNRSDGGDSPGRIVRSQETIENHRKKLTGQRWKLGPQQVENIRQAACHNRYIVFYKCGKVCYTNNLRDFARENNLWHGNLYKFLHNKHVNNRNEYKGVVNVEILGPSTRS